MYCSKLSAHLELLQSPCHALWNSCSLIEPLENPFLSPSLHFIELELHKALLSPYRTLPVLVGLPGHDADPDKTYCAGLAAVG